MSLTLQQPHLHSALLNIPSHISSYIMDFIHLLMSTPNILDSTILYLSLSLPFLCAIFHFRLRHTALASWCSYTFHLVVFNPPLVSLLWCITLCFPFINLTVCGYFHVLFCLITHLWLCRKKQAAIHMCTVCCAHTHVHNNRQKCILNTCNAKTSTCNT